MVKRSAGWARAQAAFRTLGACEVCGVKPAIERHHKDDDPLNNERSNVVFVCRRCHQEIDGRLVKIAALGAIRPTHCKRGHEFTPENTRTDRRGHRVCRACMRMLQKRWRDSR